MAMISDNIVQIDGYFRPRGRRMRRVQTLGDWGYPILDPSLGELPTGDYTLRFGQLYTFIIRLDGRPNEANVADIITNNNKGIFFDLLSVTSTFGSSNYNIAIRMRKTITYNQLMSLIKLWININLGYRVQEIDFKSGAIPAPSIFKEATQTITAPVTGISQFATSITSNIKWIAIAGAVIIGLYYLSPILRRK